MRPFIKKTILSFASAEWSLWILRTCIIGLLTGAMIHEHVFLRVDESTKLVITSCCSLLILIHLGVTLRYKRNKGKRFLYLNFIHLAFVIWMVLLALNPFQPKYHQYQVPIHPHKNTHYLEATHQYELAVVNHSHPEIDKTWVLDWKQVEKDKAVVHDDWDFWAIPRVLLTDAVFGAEQSIKIDKNGKQVRGLGSTNGQANLQRLRMFTAQKTDPHNIPGALFEIRSANTKDISTLLLSPDIKKENLQPLIQGFDNNQYSIQLRRKRIYPGFKIRFTPSKDKHSLPEIHFTSNWTGKKSHATLRFGKTVFHKGYFFKINTNDSNDKLLTLDVTRMGFPLALFLITLTLCALGAAHSLSEWKFNKEVLS